MANDAAQDSCQERKDRAVAAIVSSVPELVIVTSSWQPHTPVGSAETISVAEWQSSVRDQIDLVTAATTQVIYVAPPPYEKNVVECYTILSAPADCASRPTDGWVASSTALWRADQSSDKVTYVDTRPWFCVGNDCPPFVGGALTKADRQHATSAYIDRLVPVMTEAFNTISSIR
jgi:hypothetical protein